MAAQRERVTVAGGNLADAEHADQRFQLVRQRHADTDLIARQFVARETRFVVVFDGVGHLVGKTVVLRVVTPHDALQLGKFAHHVGEQIGLGQQRRLIGLYGQRFAAQLQTNGAGDGLHALDALALRAEFVVINDFGQAHHAGIQRLFPILVIEEFRVGQTRTHHALVAADDQTGIPGCDIGDDQKLVGQFSLRVQQREIFLVRLHGQDQTFLRHFEELGFKFSHQHVRALDQRRHFIKQLIILNILKIFFFRRRSQLPHNVSATLAKTGNHRAFCFQLPRVAIGLFQHDICRRCLKTMALGGIAGSQPQHADGDDFVTIERHQPMRRTHEIDRRPAVASGVGIAHHLGDGQFAKRIRECLLQPFRQLHACHPAIHKQGFRLAVHGALQPRHA